MTGTISGVEWPAASEAGTRCGIFGCFDEKLSKCHLCSHHYCAEHLNWHEKTVLHAIGASAVANGAVKSGGQAASVPCVWCKNGFIEVSGIMCRRCHGTGRVSLFHPK